MRRFLDIILLLLLGLMVVTCSDYDLDAVFYEDGYDSPIVFMVSGDDTRSGVVTADNLNTLHVSAFRQTYYSGAVYFWDNVEFTRQGNYFVTDGRYWPSSNSDAGSYRFAASNREITGQENGFVVDARGCYDDVVIAAKQTGITPYQANSLVFQHIYARLGTVTVSAKSGMVLSNVSVTMTPKSGRFFQSYGDDVPSSANTGWGAFIPHQEGNLTTIASGVGTFSPGLCFVPGTYTLNLSWTVTDATGVYTASFSNTKNVEFKMGENTTLNITLGGDPKDIIFTAGVADWETTATQEVDKDNLLCFEFITSGTLFLETDENRPASTLEYSRNGSAWNPVFTSTSRYNYAGAPQFVAGDKVFVRGSNTTMAASELSSYALRFCLTGDAYVYGNMSAILTNGTETVPNNAYSYLFSYCGSRLKSHPTKDLVLPAVNLGEYAYQYMFQNCTGITRMPVVKAESFGRRSCYGMFSGCTSLTDVSKLDVITLSPFCLSYMFRGCTSLVSVPKDMLLAVDLSNGCYSNMFYGCTSLTDAPVLPAAYLPESCYNQMFYGCTGLHRVEAYFESKAGVSYESDALCRWLGYNPSQANNTNGPSTGVLVKSPNNTMTKTEMSLPSGWTLENAY